MIPSLIGIQLSATIQDSGLDFTRRTRRRVDLLAFGTPGENPDYQPAKPDPEIPGPRHPDPNLPNPGDPPNMPSPMTDPPPSEPAPTPSIQPPVKGC